MFSDDLHVANSYTYSMKTRNWWRTTRWQADGRMQLHLPTPEERQMISEPARFMLVPFLHRSRVPQSPDDRLLIALFRPWTSAADPWGDRLSFYTIKWYGFSIKINKRTSSDRTSVYDKLRNYSVTLGKHVFGRGSAPEPQQYPSPLGRKKLHPNSNPLDAFCVVSYL